MQINTHQKTDSTLCGEPLLVEKNFSRVALNTTDIMAVDQTGLVHGGFVFGLADYAAMIAVNHPHVVLGAAEVKFLKPVKSGDRIEAEARIIKTEGKKQIAEVIVRKGSDMVFEGTFICFILKQHVLDPL